MVFAELLRLDNGLAATPGDHARQEGNRDAAAPADHNHEEGNRAAAAPTVLLLHAHPDDETLATGGLMARLAAEGVRVVLVTGTRGERGEVVPGPLKHLEATPQLVAARVAELDAAVSELGVLDHRFLGATDARAHGLEPRTYSDSGMRWQSEGVATWAADAPSDALSKAALDEAVADVLAVIAEVRPDVLVSYDEHGGYGHPDHVRMHDTAVAAAERSGVPLYTIVPAGSEPAAGDVVVPLGEYRPAKLRALGRHRTQLSVDGDDVVLSGGQRSPIGDAEVFRRRPEAEC